MEKGWRRGPGGASQLLALGTPSALIPRLGPWLSASGAPGEL